jgi:hypothetical protein
MRRICALLLLVPVVGFGCEYFGTVTVPASDSDPPIMATRYWLDGVETITFDPVEEVVTDLETLFVVVPAVYDSGGAASLSLRQSVRVGCHNFSTDIGQLSIVHLFDKSSQQDGSPGDSVENGLYTSGDINSMAEFEDYCVGGFVLDSVEYSWFAEGTDFAGNESSTWGRIVYEIPPGNCGCENSGFGNVCVPAWDDCGAGYVPHCDPQIGSCGACVCE